MAKTYTLEKSHATGWWVWQCKDGSGTGSSPSKGGARDEAKAACKGAVRIIPPSVDGEFRDGKLVEFTALNLDEEPVRYKTTQIREEAFLFFFGVDCLQPEQLTDLEKATTILTIWGLFRGGATPADLKKRHNLSDAQFKVLVARQVNGLQISIADSGKLNWKFRSRRRAVGT